MQSSVPIALLMTILACGAPPEATDAAAIHAAPSPRLHVRPATGNDDGLWQDGTPRRPYRGLQSAIERAPRGATLVLAPGIYRARPRRMTESHCANCQTHEDTVAFTAGFVLRRPMQIEGAGPNQTILVSNAGYGLLISGAGAISLRGLSITGGVRDLDPHAASSAVVVRTTVASLTDVWALGNNDSLETGGYRAGIGGFAVREGGDVRLEAGGAMDNSWDGLTVYRDGRATVTDSVFHGGRGVALAAVWNGELHAIRNRLSEYWKGIGAFGHSRVRALNNEIFDNRLWGVAAAGTGTMWLENNTIVRQGNCGIWVKKRARAHLINNILQQNGRSSRQLCPPSDVWFETTAALRRAEFHHNLVGPSRAAALVGGRHDGGARPLSGAWLRSHHVRKGEITFPAETDFDALGSDLARHQGDPARTNPDGSRSHLGANGGPAAAGPAP